MSWSYHRKKKNYQSLEILAEKISKGKAFLCIVDYNVKI